MAKDDSGGLLSKVVKFVRNPATSWADLDQAESERESSNSRQMLKDLVERRKRNDFVRKREFEMLRKLRRREAAGAQSPLQRPSFFQSSLPSKPDERAQTLKKIDEIEAQMSMQWWKTKHRESSVNSSVFPSSFPGQRSPAPMTGQAAPMLEPMPPAKPMGLPDRAGPVEAAHSVKAGDPVKPPFSAPRALPFAVSPVFEPSGSGFSTSRALAIDVGEIAHDPELEEAAIRFANGDDQGAEAGLLDALGSNGASVDVLETWLTLFDLYRATGQQARFDIAAMDFANQFQRSAPQWFSMPEKVSQLAQAPAQPSAGGSRATHWSCPPLLTVTSLGVLADVVARTASPWRLDWSRLSAIEAGALPMLTRLFQDWAGQAVGLHVTAGDQLERVLASGAPSGDRSVAPEAWHAHMALLRLMSRVDDFELAALNFCVTYEVSPPSWEPARCTFKSLSAEGSTKQGPTTIIGDTQSGRLTSGPDSMLSDFRSTTMESMLLPPASVELSGSIIGDVSTTIERLDRVFSGADILLIACDRLIRVDFAAAGSLLNWVSQHHANGRQVHFSGVHRLIFGFFNVVGISEMSQVTVRTD